MKDNHKYERYMSGGNESRWADSEEIKKTTTKICLADGHSPACGIPIISDGHTAFVDNSDLHTIILSGTAGGKTRRIGMPLLNIGAMSRESWIITDPKGELHRKTSGHFAAMGYKVFTLNFRKLTRSSFWNPLQMPYELFHKGKIDEAVEMINDFIGVLAESQRRCAKDLYWIEMGVSLFFALMIIFIETATPEEANIYNFTSFFTEKSSPEAIEEICQCVANRSLAALNLKSNLTNKDAKSTFGNVTSMVSNMVSQFIYRKALCQVLSKSSFDIRNIGKEKTAIYLIIPDEKSTFNFLSTLFIKQAYEILVSEAQKQPDEKLPIRLNFMLDEFCNIPTIPDMASMITAARSRNIRFFLMVQGIHQLRQKYGEDAETIKGNCGNQVFLTSREPELLNNMSYLCGDISDCDSDGTMRMRPLISTSELQRLNKEKGQALILHDRHYPYMAELPDIDSYVFKDYPPVDMEDQQLPEIVSYNIENVLSEIKSKKRPLPGSVEVFGHETYYEKSGTPSKDIFDW